MTWFPAQPHAPGVRLFCLPHAGGSATMYRPWVEALAPDIAVVPVQPPGRDNRRDEPPETDLGRLVDRIVEAIGPWTDRPYALFGHSLGAIVAFELARRLAPLRLFVSGSAAPPDAAASERRVHTLPDDELLTTFAAMGGIPTEPDLATAILPQLRADCAAAETYRYRDGDRLTCPISVLCGRSDSLVEPALLGRWSAHTSGGSTTRVFPGDHFYLTEMAGFVHRAIRKDLRGTPRKGGRDDHLAPI